MKVENKVDDSKIFAFDKPLREREPELFGKIGSPKKPTIKKPKV